MTGRGRPTLGFPPENRVGESQVVMTMASLTNRRGTKIWLIVALVAIAAIVVFVLLMQGSGGGTGGGGY